MIQRHRALRRKRHLGRGRAGNDAIKGGIIELTGNEKGAAHLIEMSHEIADRRNKGIGIKDFHGINTAGITIDQVHPRKGKLPIDRLPTGSPIGPTQNTTFPEKLVLAASKQTAHPSYGIRPIGRGGIGGVVPRIGRWPHVTGVKHQHVPGIHVITVIPDMRDDHAAQGTGKINPDAARGVISRIEAHTNAVSRLLAGGRIGRFAGRHGHDLLAHNHEAVVEDAHHHDQEDGQNERELDKSLALAPLATAAELNEIG